MDISIFSLQTIWTKKIPTLSIIVYFDFSDRNGFLSCAERSAQWPMQAPQAISKSLWQPSRSSGFLDLKHLSPPTYKSNGEVRSWWSGQNTEQCFLCGGHFIEVGGKKGELLVFKRNTKNYASAFHQRVNQHLCKKEQSNPPAESVQLDHSAEQRFRRSPKCSEILLDFGAG